MTGKAKLSTKAASEMLIWRLLNIFLELAREYALVVDVMLIRSNQNKVDRIIKVPQRWLEVIKNEMEPVLQICVATDSSMELNQIQLVHSHSGHHGMKQTTYFIRNITPSIAQSTGAVKYIDCFSVEE